MSTHVHKQQQQVSAQHRQWSTDTVWAVIDFVPCIHGRLDLLEGNWPNCNKKASNSYIYPSKTLVIVQVLLQSVYVSNICAS